MTIDCLTVQRVVCMLVAYRLKIQ